MKLKFFLAVVLLTSSLFFLSCGGKDKKGDDKQSTETTTKLSTDDDGVVTKINTSSLNDEASILDALQKVIDARITDEKKQNDDPNYSGHYVELTNLYTAVLKASTAFSKTLTDPAKAVKFSNKVSAIQDKMYAK